MIRRLLVVVAIAGMMGAFALTVRDIFRLSDRACLGWLAEARGNCEAFARYYAQNDTLIFSVFAILLIVLLLSNFKSTGK
jgi:hypothetical protein